MFTQTLRDQKAKRERQIEEKAQAHKESVARGIDALSLSKAVLDPDARRIYKLQKEVESTLRDLVKESESFHENVKAWNSMTSGIHTKIKEIGDFDQWLHKTEWDLLLVTQGIERAVASKEEKETD